MSKLFRPLLLLLLALSTLGFALSLLVHLLSLLGIKAPFGTSVWSLHVGIFVVWIPAVIISMKLNWNASRKDYWKNILSGCPRWMRYALYGLFAYAIINFILAFAAQQIPHGRQPLNQSAPPEVLRMFSGHWMLFYAVGFCTLYTAYIRGWEQLGRKCSQGHPVSWTAVYCEKCGEHLSTPTSLDHNNT